MKSYDVHPRANDQELYLTDSDWATASLLTDFCYPWRKATPPPTLFRALHNEYYLYFHFEVVDHDLFAATHEDTQTAVAGSDRVELFFRKDVRMHPYYCLEMDWQGRLLDNQAWFHRQMDYDWQWPDGLHFRSRLTANGYIVEGCLAKASLSELDLIHNHQVEAGIFRGEYSSHPKASVQWISWVRPDSPQPDFHIPSAFGILKLL